MSEQADKIEAERYQPVLNSWVQMQNNIYTLIMEAVKNETTKVGAGPQS